MALSLFWPPVPASRPRVSRWGTYYGKTYKAWMKAADEAIPQATAARLAGPLSVRVEFVCARPKTTKRLWPRGDGDNYEKALYDAITKKGYWHDDDQIVDAGWHKRFTEGQECPHMHIEIRSL